MTYIALLQSFEVKTSQVKKRTALVKFSQIQFDLQNKIYSKIRRIIAWADIEQITFSRAFELVPGYA